MKSLPPALLALADGSIFKGVSIGAEGQTSGEVVFNTAMNGRRGRGGPFWLLFVAVDKK